MPTKYNKRKKFCSFGPCIPSWIGSSFNKYTLPTSFGSGSKAILASTPTKQTKAKTSSISKQFGKVIWWSHNRYFKLEPVLIITLTNGMMTKTCRWWLFIWKIWFTCCLNWAHFVWTNVSAESLTSSTQNEFSAQIIFADLNDSFSLASAVQLLAMIHLGSVTRLGDLLDFEQLFKVFGNN